MGTNYYVSVPPCPAPCPHCSKRSHIHLGKSSGGWAFTFRGYPDISGGEGEPYSEIGPVIGSFGSWTALLDLGQVTDEHGTERSKEWLLELIEEKRDGRAGYCEFTDEHGNRFSNGDFT